jgi:hypothetical protein
MMFKDKPKPVNYNSYVIMLLLILVTCIHMLMVYNTNNKEIHRINFDTVYNKHYLDCDKWVITDNETLNLPLEWCVVYFSFSSSSSVSKRHVYLNSNRNLAYVYAIQHGAKWIFDTTSLLPLKDPNFLNKLVEYKLDDSLLWRNNNKYINTLPALGCVECYPPYFPVSKVKDSSTFKENKNDAKIKISLKDSLVFHSASTSHDKLYDYLKKDSMLFPEELDLSISLPVGSYTSVITYSTVFHKDMFPVLYVFKSPIIRSYFIQTYLHYINKHLTVFSPFVKGGQVYEFEYNELTIQGIPNIICNLDNEKTKYNKAEKLAICFYEYSLISLQELKQFQSWLYDIYVN